MTEHVRVIPNDDTAQLFDGDCGAVFSVLKACPDAPHGLLRCACGAEIYPRERTDGQ